MSVCLSVSVSVCVLCQCTVSPVDRSSVCRVSNISTANAFNFHCFHPVTVTVSV